MAKIFLFIQVVGNTTEIGSIIKKKAKEKSTGQMVIIILVNTRMIYSMVEALFMTIQLEINTMVSGET